MATRNRRSMPTGMKRIITGMDTMVTAARTGSVVFVMSHAVRKSETGFDSCKSRCGHSHFFKLVEFTHELMSGAGMKPARTSPYVPPSTMK